MKRQIPPVGKAGKAGVLQRGMVLLCALLARLVAVLWPSRGWRPALLALSRDYVESLVFRVHEQQSRIAYLDSIMTSMSDAVIVADLAGRITRFNKGAENIFEMDADSALGDNLFRMCADNSSDSARISEMLIADERIQNLRTELVGFGGKRTQALLTLNFVEVDGVRTAIVAVIKDNSEVEKLTRIDPLTGLANRREFDKRLRDEHQRMKRNHMESVSLLFLDVDLFGDVNKKYGHQVGDEALRRLGDVLRTSVRVIDTPARYGGEEFVVILPGTDERGALRLAERIRHSLASVRIATVQGELSITASIGVRTHREADGDDEKFVNEANMAMLLAKKRGRNRSVVFERLNVA